MERKESKATGAVMIVVVLLLLPVLYALSIGPAVLLVKNGVIAKEEVYVTYAPLVWLAEHVPLLDNAVESYLCAFWF